LLTIPLVTSVLFSHSTAQLLRLDIKAIVSDSSIADWPPVEVYHGGILMPANESKEIFTGPYTIRLNAAETSPDTYSLATSFFGLAPDYHNLDYNIKLSVGDSIFVPPLPVKNSATVKYFIDLLDDTSKTSSPEPPLNDTTSWGVSESVHYKTYWLRNSLADYRWNLRMSYLERIYNGFRSTFTVSSFYKIDYVFHPRPVDNIYMKPGLNYAIQPNKMWIDVIYGHEIDGVTPRAAAELLLYKLWGYAPRWLVTGFSGYYFDNPLQMRKLSGAFSPGRLDTLLSNEDWVDSDTGQIVVGALTRWLADGDLFLKFMELYKNSGPLDFRTKYREIYGDDFVGAIGRFLESSRTYVPNHGEMSYYISNYMQLGNYERAREYLVEIVDAQNEEAERYRSTLARCQFWLGDYDAAIQTMNSQQGEPECVDLLNMLNVAAGASDPFTAYSRCANDERDSQSILALVSALLDNGDTLAADTTISKLEDKGRNSPEYFIEFGRLRILEGKPADSLLSMAVAIALNHVHTMPHDPASYLDAGRAYLLMGYFEKSEESISTAVFLENRPYFFGQALLELGKLADLKGERSRAREYYNKVLSIKAGAYEKSLAKRYIDKKYEIKL